MEDKLRRLTTIKGYIPDIELFSKVYGLPPGYVKMFMGDGTILEGDFYIL
jgi:hypothetical protein